MYTIKKSVMDKLTFLYGKEKAEKTWKRLKKILLKYKEKIPKRDFAFTGKDVVFITYGDSFLSNDKKPLVGLNTFISRYLKSVITIVHILPFFPYSSDDGFSVIDYKMVNPELGDWGDIEAIRENVNLMFDGVINHISSKSRVFHEFLKGNPEFKDFFIGVDPETDLSNIFRPRALPLLTDFDIGDRKLSLWTTFSPDQIDLNYENPDVLLFMLDILLFYIAMGASIIRLDAIAYLWKEIGTKCLHHPKTHTVVKLLRTIFDHIAPHIKIITETNVPHEENISYFGNGYDEAHMVYQFALPPLTVYTILTHNATIISNWAKTLKPPGDKTFFYNFTASHDGIGLLPAKGILKDEEIDKMVEITLKRGGRVGYKDNSDGRKSAYELNISLFDLLSDPSKKEPLKLKVNRFVASQAIVLSLSGIPAIYYHSMVGSQNYYEGLRLTGINRSINREKLNLPTVINEIEKEGTIRNLIYKHLTKLIRVRGKHKAFHPGGEQKVLDIHPNCFALERISKDHEEKILSLINVSEKEIKIDTHYTHLKDTISGKIFSKTITLQPFEILWLQQYPQS